MNSKRIARQTSDSDLVAVDFEPDDDNKLIIGQCIGVMAEFRIVNRTFLSLEPHVAFSYSNFHPYSDRNISVFWGISLSIKYELKL